MMKMLSPFCLFLLILASGFAAEAQFRSATIGLNGLTCSMCSYAVNQSIRQLDFVKEVKIDPNAVIATVSFVPGKKVDIQKLADKVYQAGFSVGYIHAVFVFNSLKIYPGYVFSFEGDEYCFQAEDTKVVNGETTINFVNKEIAGKKGFNKSKRFFAGNSMSPTPDEKNIYYITL